MMTKLLLGTLGVVGGALLLPAAAVALLGRQFLYHPTALTEGQINALASAPGWHRESIEVNSTGSTVHLNGLFRPPSSPDAPWIVLFGGNAQSLESGHSKLSHLTHGRDCGLAVVSYRGYDGSGGTPSQDAILGDAYQVVRHVMENYKVKAEKLSLMGQSLGTGVVSQVAAKLAGEGQFVGSVVLISPYKTMASVFNEKIPLVPIAYAVPDKYPTIDVVRFIKSPVLIVHGERDTLIPIHHAEQLAEQFEGQAELVRLPEGGHNDLWSDLEMVASIQQFLGGLALL